MNGDVKSSVSWEAWTKDDIVRLLDGIVENLPNKRLGHYKKTEIDLNWENVAFNTYSAEMCRDKWLKISQKIRKFRTLLEVVSDARDCITNSSFQKHPDFPKKPVTQFFQFCMAKRPKYTRQHPDLSSWDITRMLSRKYRDLPDQKKAKYKEAYQREQELFKQKLQHFQDNYPEATSDIPVKPRTPRMLWYNHKRKAMLKGNSSILVKDYETMLRKQWADLSDKKKIKWINKSLKEQRAYKEAMQEYVQKHPEHSLSLKNIKSTLSKDEKKLKNKFDGRPEKPPQNGYALFCLEKREEDTPILWKNLAKSERRKYNDQCKIKKEEYEQQMERYISLLPEEEQREVLEENRLERQKSINKHRKADKQNLPMSAMFIFVEARRERLKSEQPDLTEDEQTVLLTQMWTQLSEKKKAKYRHLLAMRNDAQAESQEEGTNTLATQVQDMREQSVSEDYLARFKKRKSTSTSTETIPFKKVKIKKCEKNEQIVTDEEQGDRILPDSSQGHKCEAETGRNRDHSGKSHTDSEEEVVNSPRKKSRKGMGKRNV